MATTLGTRAVRRRAPLPTSNPEDNVVGVGLGRKIVEHKPTDRPSVRLYVVKKLEPNLIAPEHLLPRTIEGVETDVVETGRFRAQAIASRKRRRPVQPGCSIGFALPAPQDDLIMAGTLGAVVASEGEHFLLSNNHVLANENLLPVGSSIYQPGLLDHGDPTTDAIARLSRFVPLSTSEPNRVDCAIAALIDSQVVRARCLAKVGKLASTQPIDAVEGAKVEKVGRGTGYTVGTVFDLDASLVLEYSAGELHFTDQILIRGEAGTFSDYGDSGAIVVDSDSRRATGLLIGGSGEYSVANHIDDVLEALGVTLVF